MSHKTHCACFIYQHTLLLASYTGLERATCKCTMIVLVCASMHACVSGVCVVHACMRSCICVCVCVCVFYLNPVLQSSIEDFKKKGKGVQVAYYVNARLVRNRKQMTHEVNNTDLECGDDMAFGLLLPGQP